MNQKNVRRVFYIDDSMTEKVFEAGATVFQAKAQPGLLKDKRIKSIVFVAMVKLR